MATTAAAANAASSQATAPRRDRSDFYTGDKIPQTSIPHGTGTYVYRNKYFTYTGEWVNGVKHGHGTLIMGDGCTYEGEFAEGEITGQGLRTWPDGSSYAGQFHRGEFCGQGIYRGLRGETYEGEFLDNKRHGEGELMHADGSSYKGHFDGHRKQGEGAYTSPGGDVYRGTFVANALAKGSVAYADGSSYEGELDGNFRRHGWGAHTDALTGLVVHEGQFCAGAREQWPHALRGEPDSSVTGEAVEAVQGGTLPPLRITVCDRRELQDGEEPPAAATAAAGAKGSPPKSGKGGTRAGKKGAAAPDEPVYVFEPHVAESGRRVVFSVCVSTSDPEDPDAAPTLRAVAAIDPACAGAEDVAEDRRPAADVSDGDAEQAEAAEAAAKEEVEAVDPLDELTGARALAVATREGAVEVEGLRLLRDLPAGDYVLRAADATPNLDAAHLLTEFVWPLTVTVAPVEEEVAGE